MKLREFGETAQREWFRQILEWSRNKITIQDNLDVAIITVDIGTNETEVGHPLKRTPRYIIPVASYPHGIQAIQMSREPTSDKIWLTRAVAGKQVLILT